MPLMIKEEGRTAKERLLSSFVVRPSVVPTELGEIAI
jgi:hypothetical protein